MEWTKLAAYSGLLIFIWVLVGRSTPDVVIPERIEIVHTIDSTQDLVGKLELELNKLLPKTFRITIPNTYQRVGGTITHEWVDDDK